MTDCIFCKIVAGQIPSNKVYEDEHCLAFLDIGPVSKGHTLLIPKNHYAQLHDCPPHLVASLCSRLPQIARAVKTAANAQAYNVLCNNGSAAGQIVEHVHFHIIPRNQADGVFNRWPAGKYEQNQAEKTAENIRQQLAKSQ
jgi:histidine triad (HIT) family protein